MAKLSLSGIKFSNNRSFSTQSELEFIARLGEWAPHQSPNFAKEYRQHQVMLLIRYVDSLRKRVAGFTQKGELLSNATKEVLRQAATDRLGELGG